MKRLPVSSRIRTRLCPSHRSAPVGLSLTLDRSNRIAADTWHLVYLSQFHTDLTASQFGVGQMSNPASIRPMYISGVQRIKYKLRSLELQRGLFKDKTEPASNHKIQNTQTESIIMVHSVKNHKKREKEMRMLKKRAKGLIS